MFPDDGHTPLCLLIDLSGYEDDWQHVAAFRGGSGWLLMARATIQSEHDLLSDILIVACDDREIPIPAWRAKHLCQCPWSGLDYCDEEIPQILDELLCEEEGAFYGRWQRQANAELADLHERTELALESLEQRSKTEVGEIEAHIRNLRRQRRFTSDEETLRALSAQIVTLEGEGDAALEKLMVRRDALRRRADRAEEALWLRDDVLIDVEPSRLIRWRDGTITSEVRVSPIWRAGEFHAPETPQTRKKLEDAEIVLTKISAALKVKAKHMPVASAPLAVLISGNSQSETASHAIKEATRSANGKLSVERDLLADILMALEKKGQKFLTGSRKYIKNQEERDNLARRIAVLDAVINSCQTSTVIKSPTGRLSGDPINPWPLDRVALLKRLWLTGTSAGEIAKQIGGVSRNAVIGKAKRLGLPFQSPP